MMKNKKYVLVYIDATVIRWITGCTWGRLGRCGDNQSSKLYQFLEGKKISFLTSIPSFFS